MKNDDVDTITLNNVVYDTMSPNLDPLYNTLSITDNTLNTLSSGNFTINTGGTGATNSIYGVTYTMPTYNYPNVTISNGTTPQKSTLRLDGQGADVVLDGKSLKAFMEKVEERLLILQPDPKKLEKHAALKKAYDHYKLMEKLLGDD